MLTSELSYSVICLLLISQHNCDETTQHYLHNAIRGLRNMKNPHRRVDKQLPIDSNSGLDRSHQMSEEIPPLTLTKGELAALYQEAVQKGETLKLGTGDNEYVQAAVHRFGDEEYDKEPSSSSLFSQHEEPSEMPTEDSGYYYYYYPLKSFFDKLNTHTTSEYGNTYFKYTHPHKELTTYKPPYTYHSHHHQHNITITSGTTTEKPVKPIEPIFMAISGFIGMAVMAFVSMIIVPKLGLKGNKTKNPGKEKLDDLTKLAIRAIEGQCAERFACELTKTARSFSIEDNRFYKLLKRIAPGTFGRYMSNSEKYANKHLKCTAIPCAKKKSPVGKKTPPNQKKRPTVSKKH